MPVDRTGNGYQVVVDETVDEAVSPASMERETVAQFLSLAHDRFRTITDAESVLRQNMLEDLRFRASEQWPDHIKAMRDEDNRPCLTVNRIPSFIRQVTNNQRASRPAVQVNPTGDEGDPEIAQVLQGNVRLFEAKSAADVAYSTAAEAQVTMGRGYVRVVTDYINDDPTGLDQEIKIRRVGNPFAIYMDPSAQSPDGSDARYAFVVEDLPLSEYRWRFPRSEMAELADFTSVGNTQPEWMPEGNIRIAEYFYVEEARETFVLLETVTGERIRYPKADLGTVNPEEVNDLTVLAEREITTRQVKWALINAVEILEGNEGRTEGMDWPGKYIPIVPVLGDEININGVRDFRGIVRDAKDPQRMYNYWVSAETEMIALAPRAPFIGAEGQFEGHEVKWRTANTRNFPYLEYKPTSLSGQMAPPPQRQAWEPPIQAMTAAIAQSDNDLKATGGFHDASLGQRGPQESGRALRTRQQQDEMSNSHYLDNLGRSVRQVGRILVDLIPKIYDTARVLRILGEDDQQRSVMVFAGDQNQPSETQREALPTGIVGIYILGVGRYDVSVSVGPSFQTRRQQDLDAMVEFVQAYPNVFPMVGDLLLGNLDFPGAKQMEARLKKMLPPPLQDDVDPAKIPAPVQAQLQQMEIQLQRVQEAYQKAQEDIQTDQVKYRAQAAIKEVELAADAASQERDLQSRMKLEQIKQQGENARALARLEQTRASEVLQTEISHLDGMIERAVVESNQQEERFERRASGAPAGPPPSGPPPGSPPMAAPGSTPGPPPVSPTGPPLGPGPAPGPPPPMPVEQP